MNKRICNWFR